MRTLSSLSLVFAAVALLTQPLHSQSRAPSAREQLQTMKAANQKLLDAQKATLEKLDETAKEAAQLRIFVRRT